MTPTTARFDPTLLRWFRDADGTPPIVETAFEEPWELPWHVGLHRNAFAASLGRPSESVIAGGRMAGASVRRTLLGNPIQAAVDAAGRERPLEAALASLRERGVLRGTPPATAGVPEPVQRAAALLLRAAADTVPLRRMAVADLGDLDAVFADLEAADTATDRIDRLPAMRQRFRAFDRRAMAAAGHDLALAVQTALGMLQQVAPTERYDWRADTVWGTIRLTGGDDTRHGDQASLLIIDTGGSDVYRAPAANRSAANWASLCLDTHGDDRYLGPGTPDGTAVADFAGRREGTGFGPAGARLGVAILADAVGDDVYRTHRPGLGVGVFGVGVLLDQDGADLYDAYAFAQGAGYVGIGVLEDLAGDDRYRLVSRGQGYGAHRGFGLLADRRGGDTYEARPEVLDFPSPQSPAHNVSFAQGAGYGRRADFSDGYSLAGGVGVLVDDQGDDRYVCGVFGQGVGYWEGFGLLADAGGADRYEGQWYVQGASAHFAFGYLLDGAGDDAYAAGLNMAQGAGHDFGSGYLVDAGGNDRYQAPNLSLGAGNANGFGVFVDLAGDDAYASSGVTLGRGAEAQKGSLRERALTLGVFMDLGGTDTYPASTPWARNAERVANWTDRGRVPAEGQGGVFWDR